MPLSLLVVLVVALFAAEIPAAQKALRSPASPKAQQAAAAADIRGVWKVAELASRTPGGEWETRPIYLSQYIFTTKHYSYMYVPGAGPRKLIAGDPNRPTDAEKVEAYNSLVAATGTYTLSGQVLTMRALVHKNPNEMLGTPLIYNIELVGNTLRMVISDPPFLPGRESRTVLTRIE